MGFFNRKKKVAKKVAQFDKVDILGFNILAALPLTLLVLITLFSSPKNDFDQLQDTVNEVTAVDGDNIVDGNQYVGFRMIDANTYVSYSGRTTVKFTTTAPSTYGWTYVTTERQPILGVVLVGKIYHKSNYASIKALFSVSGDGGKYVTVTSSDIQEFLPACEKAGELLADKLF